MFANMVASGGRLGISSATLDGAGSKGSAGLCTRAPSGTVVLACPALDVFSDR